MILNEVEAKEVLGPYLDIIGKCIDNGFNRFLTVSTEYRYDLSARSKASLIHDFIIAEARSRFLGLEGVSLLDKSGLFIIDFGGIQLRFKKFNKHLRTYNIQTKQTVLFMRQGIQENFPSIPPPTKLITGYQLNQSRPNEILCIPVVCPDGHTHRWQFEIQKPSHAEIVPIQVYVEEETSERTVSVKEGIKHEKAGDETIQS